jgi:hypothetical protein
MNKFLLPLVVIVLAGALAGVFFLGNNSKTADKSSPSPKAAATVKPDPSGLPGLLTSAVPWDNNTGKLGDRLDAIGLPQLSAEGTVLHIHQHLDIFVNGQPVSVPADIGIPDSQQFISPIHVHDTSGVIHVESPVKQDFYLGQFFDVWGVKFTQNQLGGYQASSGNPLTVYVNGTKYTGDPRQIKLQAHQEIAVVYGPAPATVPSTYAFPSGE